MMKFKQTVTTLVGIIGVFIGMPAAAQTVCPPTAVILNSIPYGRGPGNSSFNCMAPAPNSIVTTGAGNIPSLTTYLPTLTRTVTITPTPLSTMQGLVVSQTGPVSGTPGADFFYNRIDVNSNGLDTTGFSTNGLLVQLITGDNARGQQYATWSLATLNKPTTGLLGDLVGSRNWAITNQNQGGTNTGAGARGTAFGGEFLANAFSGATNYLEIAGAAFDAIIQPGATVRYRYGITIEGNGSGRGVEQDYAIQIGSATAGGNFLAALGLSNANGFPPIATTGCAICTDGSANTIATGIDLASYTISGNFLKGPNGFAVDGSGNVIVSDGTASATFTYSSLFTHSARTGTTTNHNFILTANNTLAAYINASDLSFNLGFLGVSQGSLAIHGLTSGIVSVNVQAAAGTFNFNMPTTAGTSGQVLTSAGGVAAPMTWTTPATGTITSIATTSPITGGTITATGTIACATCVTSAAALTANQIVIGAGLQASAATTTGTGVLAALAINVGSAGAFVTFNGALGTPSSGVATNLTGTASGLTAGSVTTNANLTGPITSVGNATSIASQTGTGTKFVVDTSPSISDPTFTGSLTATGLILNASLAIMATNTIKGNATSGSASPTNLAVGSCSTSSSALNWTTNTGPGCNTAINAAQLGGATFAAPGAIGGGTPGAGTFTVLTGTSGSITGLTGFALRDTSAAFNVTLVATSTSSALTAGRNLTFDMGNVAHILTFGTTANTGSGIIFPNTATDTVAMLGAANNFSAINTFSNSTDSTTTTTGGALFSGGIGVVKNATIGGIIGIGGVPISGRSFAVYGNQAPILFVDNNGTATFKVIGFLYDGKNALDQPGWAWQNLSDAGAFVSNSGVIWRDGAMTLGSITYPGEAGSLRVEAQIYVPNMSSDTATSDSTVCIATTGAKLLKGTGTLGICLGTSGRQFKREETFKSLDDGLAQIAQLSPLNFFYKPGYGDGGQRLQYGFLADEVEPVLPNLVGLDNQGVPNSVDILGMVPILVRAAQQLKADNDNLRAVNETLMQAFVICLDPVSGNMTVNSNDNLCARSITELKRANAR